MEAPIERARWWSWRRQRLDRTCRGVEDCLQSVIGVYSANPHGALSLLARVPRLLKGAAVEGVISTKRAVRVPAMRRSIFMLPRETAHLAFWATPRSVAPYRQVLRRAGVGDREWERLRSAILAATEVPLEPAEIRARLGSPPKDLTPVLHAMCAEGVLLRIKARTIRSSELSYCATEAWLGEPLRQVDPTEALVWLAGDYLTAYGPATPEDFAWWTGVPRKQAAEALASLEPVDVGGGWLMHRRDERAFSGMRKLSGRVNLLPKWDCYTMGYGSEGRSRFATPAVQKVIYDAGGNAQPVVLIEGEVGGTWEHRILGDRIRIKLSLFEQPAPALRDALDSEAALVATFLEAARSTIAYERVERPRARRARAPSKRRPTIKPRRTAAKAAGTRNTSKKTARRKTTKKKSTKTSARKSAKSGTRTGAKPGARKSPKKPARRPS